MEGGYSLARLDPEGADRMQTLRRELGVTAFGLNLVVLGPGMRGRIHAHRHQEEVYLTLAGRLTLVIEGTEHELEPGALARVAPGLRRQLVNRTRGRVEVLAVGGAGDHVGRDGIAWSAWEDSTGRPVPEVPLPADLPPGELRA